MTWFKEERKKKEPNRMAVAKEKIKALGYTISYEDDNCIRFLRNGHIIQYFPFTGWHTGKGIVDGRGLANLLKQIKTDGK